MEKRLLRFVFIPSVFLILILVAGTVLASTEPSTVPEATEKGSKIPWWAWSIILLVFTFILGILAVLGGVGGGVLFVPLVGGFFPFHIDFVRGAGLIVALSGALAAGPGLLKRNLASLRLALPVALIASSAAIIGAMIGLALPAKLVNILLGATIIGIVIIMASAKKSDFPNVPNPDGLSQALGIMGIYREVSLEKDVEWKIHRTAPGLVLFIVIGVMAGMFGLGAGWANVPVLNLLMGAPLKISVATSKFLLSITDTSAAWIYLNSGAVLPMIVVPSVVGIMLGSIVGVRILARTKPKAIKWMVIGLLLFAGVRALLKGLEIWK
ncbi:MAG: sulfite exporter TauE/SafE family protein [Nitrospirota bacterium]